MLGDETDDFRCYVSKVMNCLSAWVYLVFQNYQPVLYSISSNFRVTAHIILETLKKHWKNSRKKEAFSCASVISKKEFDNYLVRQ